MRITIIIVVGIFTIMTTMMTMIIVIPGVIHMCFNFAVSAVVALVTLTRVEQTLAVDVAVTVLGAD